MNNPLNLMKAFMKGRNSPQELAKTMLSKNTNPLLQNIVTMANNGDTKGVENFARNMCKERGIDFDKEFSEFMKNFK